MGLQNLLLENRKLRENLFQQGTIYDMAEQF